MPSSSDRLLEYHHPEDDQLSLRHVTDDADSHQTRRVELEESGADVRVVTDLVDGDERYLIYTQNAPEQPLPDFESEEDMRAWLQRRFDSDTLPVVLLVMKIFNGIQDEKGDKGDELDLYKQMELEKIPTILERVQWRQPVPEVGASLLSQFILKHPMPNTNHRTGISLVERYFTSIDSGFTMPGTGEDGEWYDWVKGYIYDSKRLLTIRNSRSVLRYAADLGYEQVRRKEGTTIDLNALNFARSDFFDYYTGQHTERTEIFIDKLLERTGMEHLWEEDDPGKAVFVDRLRGAP